MLVLADYGLNSLATEVRILAKLIVKKSHERLIILKLLVLYRA